MRAKDRALQRSLRPLAWSARARSRNWGLKGRFQPLDHPCNYPKQDQAPTGGRWQRLSELCALFSAPNTALFSHAHTTRLMRVFVHNSPRYTGDYYERSTRLPVCDRIGERNFGQKIDDTYKNYYNIRDFDNVVSNCASSENLHDQCQGKYHNEIAHFCDI